MTERLLAARTWAVLSEMALGTVVHLAHQDGILCSTPMRTVDQRPLLDAALIWSEKPRCPRCWQQFRLELDEAEQQ